VLAQAVTDRLPDSTVLLVCSAEGVETFQLPAGVDVLRLPGLRKVTNREYASRRLRIDERAALEMRSSLLASAVATFRPDVLLADKHPLGVRRELLAALNRLRIQGGRAVLGLRDVLDDNARSHGEWQAGGVGSLAAELYDLVLVYGSEDVLSPATEGLLPAEMAGRVRHCGYVVAKSPTTRSTDDLMVGDRPIVVATVGGGEDGLPLLTAFLEASRGSAWQAVAVAGPQMPDAEWAEIERCAQAADATAFRSVRQVDRWFKRAAALVCMGGYNTLVEALATPIPVVCVPRTEPRREQLIRAMAFAARGLVHVVEPGGVNGAALACAIEKALATNRDELAARVRTALDLGGAQRAAVHLTEMAALPVSRTVDQPVRLPA